MSGFGEVGRSPLRILWVKTELLHPVDRGGRIRSYQMLRQLRELHHVTYLALDDGSAGEDAAARAHEYCHRLLRVPVPQARRGSLRFYAGLAGNLASSLPYVCWKFRSAALEARIRELVEADEIDLVVCDFLYPSSNVPADLPVPVVLFQHNVEAQIWRRHLDVASNPLARSYFALQWRRMRRFEMAECRRVSHVVAVSDADRDRIRDEYGVSSVSAVPTGVDTDYFRPSRAVQASPHELVFTGAMDWLPNEDGMSWFAAEILPLVRRLVPTATLTIVGRNPSATVRALAERVDGVTVTGGVPDVRPFLERAAAFVVPLRIGGGTRLKIYEAMAMERPVVSTNIGAEGLPLRDGREVVLADGPERFARAVADLLTDRTRADQIARTAAERVRAEFSWRRVAEQFSDSCLALVPGEDPAPATSIS